MPVVTITALSPGDGRREAALAAVPPALAGSVGCNPEAVWVYWVDAAAVRMGSRDAEYEGHCPVVVVRARVARTDEAVAAGMVALGEALSRELGLPYEDIWVHWVDVPSGRVLAGGTLP